jgi:sensor histidine kinase YesM
MGRFVLAQSLSPIVFDGQPTLEEGISVEPYALFYVVPTADTLQTLSSIATQNFVPSVQVSYLNHRTVQKLSRTNQVVWLQFQVKNAHPTDTLRLVYSGGPHGMVTLYQKEKDLFRARGSAGFFVPSVRLISGYSIFPIQVPPNSTNQYFVRVVDYLLQLGDVAGELHTRQSFQWFIAQEVIAIRLLFGLLATMLGCIILMCVYSLYLYFLNLDKAFLFYAFYTAMAACHIFLLANARFGFYLMPTFLPRLSHPIGLSTTHILALFYSLFLSNLLNIPGNQPKLWKVIKALMVLLALLQIMEVLQIFSGTWINNSTLYFMLDTLPTLLMGILMILATLRSDSKLKPYLLTGQISLYMIVISPFHGLFVVNNVSQEWAFLGYPGFYIALGLTIELFCFALALAYRNKLVELEKNHLQQHYTQQLETELKARTQEVEEQSRQLEQQHIRQLELDFEQQLAEVQMKALRAQMNPHFIFNCLNSIQLYTTSNEAAKATDYLNRFSQLIRLVLENSRSERVTLRNELEALELYLQMEAMRFKDKLRHKIEVASELDTELIEIPPMLLQPYVENAVWHGLMHKSEGGYVQVKVAQLKADCLIITITDDGIGRTRAAGLKSKSATLHKSFGMKMTGERIALINQMYKTQTQVQIHDLMDAEGNPAGTEVVLEIPV